MPVVSDRASSGQLDLSHQVPAQRAALLLWRGSVPRGVPELQDPVHAGSGQVAVLRTQLQGRKRKGAAMRPIFGPTLPTASATPAKRCGLEGCAPLSAVSAGCRPGQSALCGTSGRTSAKSSRPSGGGSGWQRRWRRRCNASSPPNARTPSAR